MKCKYCNAEIKTNPTYQRTFCNRICMQLYQKELVRDSVYKCSYCGKSVKKISRRKGKSGLVFCNRLCSNRYFADKKSTQTFIYKKKIIYKKVVGE